MIAEWARGLLSGEVSRPDEHETRRPAPRFPQPRIDDFTLKRSRGAVCRLYYPRRLFGGRARKRGAGGVHSGATDTSPPASLTPPAFSSTTQDFGSSHV